MMGGIACQNSVYQPSNNQVSDTASDRANCRTIHHEMGETEVCGQPQRIVVFGPAHLESLLVLDVYPVGYVAHINFLLGDYTNPAQQIPYLGDRVASLTEHHVNQPIANMGSIFQPSIEAILQMKPDLIIGTEFDKTVYDTLSQIAPTLLLDYYNPEDNLRAIAQAVDRPEKVEQLLKQTQQQIAAAREAFAPLVATHPRALLLSGSQLQTMSLGGTDVCGSLVEELGFQLVLPPGMENNNPDTEVPISLEILSELNDVDLILVLGYNFSDFQAFDNPDQLEEHQLSSIKQAWEENPIAQSLEASKAGQVYFLQDYLCISLPGPIGTELYLEELQEKLLAPI